MSKARLMMAGGTILMMVAALAIRSPVRAQRVSTEAKTQQAKAVSESEAKIRAALSKPSKFVFMQRSLTDFAQMISDQYGINVRLDQVALDAYGLGPDTPVELNIKDVSLRSALAMILEPLELTWTIRHETLTITTQEEAEYHLVTRVYNVRDLVQRDIDPTKLPLVYSKLSPSDEFYELCDLLMYSIDPETWDEVGGPGSVNGIRMGERYALVVCHTEVIQEKVAKLLGDLRQIPAPPAADEADVKHAAAKEDPSAAHYVQVYPIIRTARAPTEQLEELVRVSVGRDNWSADDDTFVRGVAEAIVVRHNNTVHKQTYQVLVGVGAIAPVYDSGFFPHFHGGAIIPVVGDRGEAPRR